ncbi:MAG TPA: DUF4388 domain-containing protein [Thermoanaerobaculia bacterium]
MDVELQSALFDFQRYLLDQIPPLTASDAIEILMAQPPEVLIKQIHAWTLEQSRHQSAAQSDFLFHALKKVYLFSVLKLIDRAEVERYLDRVVPLALQVCPSEERETLRMSLQGMRDSMILGGSTSTVVPVSREKKAEAAPKGAISEAAAKTARRLSLVVERLAKHLPFTSASPEPQAQPRPAAQLVTMAAASATSEAELQAYVRELKPYTGGESDPAKLLHVLAADVPQWEVALPPDAKQPAAIEAMHKIITLTSSSSESTQRFRDLMTEAVEQFNNGALGPAVSMLELAARVVVEKKIDPIAVERIRGTAVESISSERLKKYTENKTKHALLRAALSHFPTLTKASLFQQLRGEQRPERRRALLSLLEAYGREARAAATEELEAELNREPAEIDTYYLRNVIYLLHRVPREADEPMEKELELLTRATVRGQNIYVIKEAIIPLGHMKSEAAAKVLTMRLAEIEAMLLRKDISLYPLDEMQKVLDRITSALGRIATPAALLTVARHGMKPNPLLGDTRARLAVLSSHDLSFDEQTVDILIGAIREDLPTKLLGRVLPSRNPPPLRLIEALSSTRAERVEVLFGEIAEKFPEHEVGRAAAAALYNLTSTAAATARQATAATLTGDLDFFGLPSLLQSLADQQATGIVTLTGRHSGQTAGKLLFVNGKFADAQTAHLRGVEALYQLLERPLTGVFAFVPNPAAKPRGDVHDVMGLLFEGIRRHDEYRQLVLFVPDDLTLRATATKPTPDPEETDPAIVRDVWVKASSGARLGDWEQQVAVDCYRVRRLVARWIEEGALQPAA